ncbi:putative cutinase transcription factor 1 alpha [Fusarium oxysporum II5]|nr:putative cutinase transcription factor 1 alpha [Fusarium oxysporum II5]
MANLARIPHLPNEINQGVKDRTASVSGHLLHLAYKHNFVKQGHCGNTGNISVTAASKISKFAEGMLTQGTLRYGQMHSITSLFSALSIHAISIRRGTTVRRRIAESRVQMRLLGLQEIQKYWRINNNNGVSQTSNAINPLPLSSNEEPEGSRCNIGSERISFDFPTSSTQVQDGSVEEQYMNMLYGVWEYGYGTADSGTLLQAHDSLQLQGFDILGRSL